MRSMISHQLTQNLFPGFQQGFVPFAMPLAGAWFYERVLDASSNGILWMLGNHSFQAWMMFPNISRIIWNRCPGMTMVDETTVDPFSTDMIILKRIEYEVSVFNRLTDVEDFLLAGIVDFKNDMGMVQCHPKWDPLFFHKISDFFDSPEIL